MQISLNLPRALLIVCVLPLLFSCGQKEIEPTPPVEDKTYFLTVSVLGEGTVTEKVVSTRADYSSGTVVELTANPSLRLEVLQMGGRHSRGSEPI